MPQTKIISSHGKGKKRRGHVFLPYLVLGGRHSNCFSSFTGGGGGEEEKMRLERLKKALATPSFPAVLTNFCETDGGWLKHLGLQTLLID